MPESTHPQPDHIDQMIQECLQAWDWAIEAPHDGRADAMIVLRRYLLHVHSLHRHFMDDLEPEPESRPVVFDPNNFVPATPEQSKAEVERLVRDQELLLAWPVADGFEDRVEARPHAKKGGPGVRFLFEGRMQDNSPLHVSCPHCGTERGYACYATRKGGPKGGFKGIDLFVTPFRPIRGYHRKRMAKNRKRLA